jgi:hypothetical protein
MSANGPWAIHIGGDARQVGVERRSRGVIQPVTLARPGQRSASVECAEHQVGDLAGLLQVRLVRHPGQLAVAAFDQAAG